MEDEHVRVFVGIPRFKQPLPAEDSGEQPLLSDIERDGWREIGLLGRHLLTAGDWRAFKNLGDRTGEVGEGRHWHKTKSCE
jgi:hypothetical protein